MHGGYNKRGIFMIVFKQGDVKIDGVKIHYYRHQGGKQTILLLHGATDNGLCWARTAQELAQKYDVIMPDAQGHGLSDRLQPGYSFDSQTSQVAGLVKELGLKKPIIMGHSMGAGTTSNVAVEYPEIPKAIILEDPAWGMFPPTPENIEANKQRHKEIQEYQLGVAKLSIPEIIDQCHKDNPTWQEYDVIPWAESRKQFDPALLKNMIANSRPYEELVARIQCPTLLIIAENGIVTKAVAENAARLWKAKAPFKWVYIKGAGHSIRREQYDAYKQALDEFLIEIK
jgi:pimeloyl-ACP methyl ester carboxylesterase